MAQDNATRAAFPTDFQMQCDGLTKREYLAAALMAGSLTNPALFEAVGAGCQGIPQDMYKAFAAGAVAMADQLLTELAK